MTIKVLQWVIPSSQTPNDTHKFHAECEIDGRKFVAESRRGAVCKLARILVAEGIPDDRVNVFSISSTNSEGMLSMSYASFVRHLAPFSYGESAKMTLRQGKFFDRSVLEEKENRE
jgi:hypothetical protein